MSKDKLYTLEPVQDRYERLSVGAQKPEFTGVNEDFEHRPTANGGGAVDLEQVLDGADIISFDAPNRHIAYANLALLFAQFHPDNDHHIASAFDYYASRRNWDINQQLIAKIN